jgi:hypothetical protein
MAAKNYLLTIAVPRCPPGKPRSAGMSWLLSIVIVLFLLYVLTWFYQAVREDSELGNASRRRQMRNLGRRSVF